ncbi:hypothetical protein ACIQRZ_18875 [Streptomyces rubiginosohelvolus]|uniref:hypothetical protein n=1 Tax=Streptomyces rubiginosohelvolus TaxID=67362 RepID=UPI0037F9D47C
MRDVELRTDASDVVGILARHDQQHGSITTGDIPAPELLGALDMPGKVADFLRTTDLEPAERTTLDQGSGRAARPGPRPAHQRHARRHTSDSSTAASPRRHLGDPGPA